VNAFLKYHTTSQEKAKPVPLPGVAELPGPNESNRKKLPPSRYGSSLFEPPGLPPNRDGVASKLEFPKNDAFLDSLGDPNAFLGEPKECLGEPNAFLGDPNAFDLGESNAPNAFL